MLSVHLKTVCVFFWTTPYLGMQHTVYLFVLHGCPNNGAIHHNKLHLLCSEAPLFSRHAKM